MRRVATRLLLAGGGHSHIEVLRRLRAAPDAALDVTLVSPDPVVTYSGMLPGVIAGHYRLHEAQIALPDLAHAARVEFVAGRLVALDLAPRVARLEGGRSLAFDLLSLDVGSTPDSSLPGSALHSTAVRPANLLLAAWEQTMAAAPAGQLRALAVVGGGAAGVEILLAMQHRLASLGAKRAPRCALVTDQPDVLMQHAGSVRRAIRKTSLARGISLHLSSPVVAIERGAVLIANGARIDADRTFVAISASAAPFLAASGLECDPRGFVRVDACLRSISHPFVFASGDCATQVGSTHPKSGLNAVRQGRRLATNLLRAQRGELLRPFASSSLGLALIATGDRRAILSYGSLAAQGAWAWRLKDAIDRRYLTLLRAASAASD